MAKSALSSRSGLTDVPGCPYAAYRDEEDGWQIDICHSPLFFPMLVA